jgi:homoserine O-acetyltransferase
MVGAGLALDTSRYRVIGTDFIGAPGTTAPAGPSSTTDQARLVIAILDRLGVERTTIVGASYGGMVALATAAGWPERVSRLVVACAAHRQHPMATAVRAIQRAIVVKRGRPSDESLVLARALSMTTYRSTVEFESRFGVSPDWSSGVPVFPVEEYLMARGAAFAERFDAESFVRLSTSIDLHEVDPETIECSMYLLSVDTDSVVPEFLADELAASVRRLRAHVKIESPFGHDAFLKETTAVSAFLESSLRDGCRPPGIGDPGGGSIRRDSEDRLEARARPCPAELHPPLEAG